MNTKKKDINQSLQVYIDFNKKTIQDWVNAQRLATATYSNQKPLKRGLIDVFDKVQLDPHLTAILQQRTSKILGEKFEIVRDNKVDDKLTELINKNWLQQFLLGSIRSRYYGYTLFEIDDIDNTGEITSLLEVNRRNVLPESREVFQSYWNDANVISIDNDEDADYLYLVTDHTNPAGLLNKAVPSVLRKLHAQTAWLEHAQVAGLPLLFATLKDASPANATAMLENLLSLAQNGVGVGGEGDKLQVLDRNGSGHSIYLDLVEFENSELTKLILSQTGTTEANSSYSQAKTHKTVADEIAEEDKTYCTNAFNMFIPKLVKLGYPLQGCKGRFAPDNSSDPEKVKMVEMLLKYYDIDEDVIKEITNIDVNQKLSKQRPTE